MSVGLDIYNELTFEHIEPRVPVDCTTERCQEGFRCTGQGLMKDPELCGKEY